MKRNFLFLALIGILIIFLLGGCVSQQQTGNQTPAKQTPEDSLQLNNRMLNFQLKIISWMTKEKLSIYSQRMQKETANVPMHA